MKKTISLVLALVLCLSLCACGSNGSASGKSEMVAPSPVQNGNNSGIWSLQTSTDEFGDVTEDSVSFVAGLSQGTFSNTATSGSDLTVATSFMKKPGYNHYIAVFDLKEYNDRSATFYEYDTITLKMKIGDDVLTDYLTVTSSLTNNSADKTLAYGAAEYTWGGDLIFNALYDGKDVRCIITSGSSQYQFTLESSNLKSLCEDNGFSRGAGDQTVKESVKTILDDSGTGITFTKDWFRKNIEKLELMDTNEISSLLDGYFLRINFESPWPDPVSGDYLFPNWFIYYYNFSNNTGEEMATHLFDTFNDNIKVGFTNALNSGEKIHAYNGLREYTAVNHPLALSLDAGILTVTATLNGNEWAYQVRKITDDCFMLCQYMDGEYKATDLLFRANGATLDDVFDAHAYAFNTTLNQIYN